MFPLAVVCSGTLSSVAPALGEGDGPRPLVQPLLETAKKHEGKRVLVIFSARWDLSGAILKELMEDPEVRAVLRSDGVVTYVADCTAGESVGAIELRRHGSNAVPMSAALLHPDGMITFTRLNLTSAKTLASNLRDLVKKEAQDQPSK